MKSPNRNLSRKEEVRMFLSQLDILEYIKIDKSFVGAMEKFLKKEKVVCDYTDENIMIDETCKIITKLHREMDKYGLSGNTMENETLRDEPYKDEIARNILRNEIVKKCLTTPILDDDDLVDFKNGGIAPPSRSLKADGEMFLLIGCPASGKSSYAHKIVEAYDAFLVDSDIFKRKFPEYRKSHNSANFLHKESQIIKDKVLTLIAQSRKNLVVPTIGKNYDELIDLINNYTKIGYKISIILFDVKKDHAVLRALKRYFESGRYVSLSYVFDTCGHEAVATFYRIAAEQHDRCMIAIDNNTNPSMKGRIEFHQHADHIIKLFNDKIISE